MTTASGPPPGWYPDPAGFAQLRYWGGGQWTGHVAVGGNVFFQPLPPAGQPMAGVDPAEPDARAAMPSGAAVYAAVGMVLGFVGSLVAGLGMRALFGSDQPLLILVPAQAALWTGLLGACVLASRRFGTGSMRVDYGVRMQWIDVPLGLGASIAGRIAATVAVVPIVLISRRFIGSNDRLLREFDTSSPELLVVCVIAIIGAPLVEELFFRGLLLQVLTTAWGTVRGIIAQAAVFGVCHISPLLGLGNVSVVVAIAVFGTVQGVVVDRCKRLGPAIWSHLFFNLVAVLVVTALT